MKIRTWGVVATVAFALSPLAPFSDLHAQEYQHGAEMQNCVSTYYDPSFYGWLAIRNTCAVPITVTFVGGTGGNSGTMTLAAGSHSSTGYSRSDWASAGGIYYAVCNADYSPIESNGWIWLHSNRPFLCKRH